MLYAAAADPIEGRKAFTLGVLKEPPAHPPGSKMEYSNAGYIIAAAMAEKATKQTWQSLIEESVFKPLSMTNAGFGWPADGQPSGHRMVGGTQLPASYPYAENMAPAGNVHGSLSDLAKYVSAHLLGLQGKDSLLQPGSFQRLHTPPAGSDYAMGWSRVKRAGENATWHDGSAKTFFTWMTIWPQHNLAVAVVNNSGSGEAACEEATNTLFSLATGKANDPNPMITARARTFYNAALRDMLSPAQVTPIMAADLVKPESRVALAGLLVLGAPRFAYVSKRSDNGVEIYSYQLSYPSAPAAFPDNVKSGWSLDIAWDSSGRLHTFLIER